MDTLTIHDLEVSSRIGVPEEERQKPQRLLVTVECAFDARKASASDDVSASVNYFDLAQDIKALAATERKIIERFAEDIAAMALQKYKPEHVTVTVRKFALPDALSASVTITRP